MRKGEGEPRTNGAYCYALVLLKCKYYLQCKNINGLQHFRIGDNETYFQFDENIFFFGEVM